MNILSLYFITLSIKYMEKEYINIKHIVLIIVIFKLICYFNNGIKGKIPSLYVPSSIAFWRSIFGF